MTNAEHTRSAPRARGFKTTDLLFLLILVGSIAFILFSRSQPSAAGVAQSATLFAGHSTFEDAAAAAELAGQPVLVFATADWCGPCQTMKATTLADPSVQQSIQSMAVPYKLDVTSMSDMSASDGALAQRLGVSGIPASYIVRPDGQVSAKAVGSMGKDRYVEWVNQSVAAGG